MRLMKYLRANELVSFHQASRMLAVSVPALRMLVELGKVTAVTFDWKHGEFTALRESDIVALRDQMYGGWRP